MTLEPLDAKAARDLALNMLQRWKELVPKSLNVRPIPVKQTKPSSRSSGSINGRRIGFTLLWAFGAAVAGLILFIVVGSITSATSEGDKVTSAPSVFLGTAALLFFVSPVLGGVFYWRRSPSDGMSQLDRPNRRVSVTGPARTRYTRDELLSGQAKTSVTFEVADGIIEKLQASENAETFRKQLGKGRR